MNYRAKPDKLQIKFKETVLARGQVIVGVHVTGSDRIRLRGGSPPGEIGSRPPVPVAQIGLFALGFALRSSRRPGYPGRLAEPYMQRRRWAFFSGLPTRLR